MASGGRAPIDAAAGRVRGWRPWMVGVLGALAALCVVFGRLTIAADGDVTKFVLAGDAFVDREATPAELHVYDNSFGYDGQFFWRLGVDPAAWDLERQHGVQFDNGYRPSRIGYPALAWLGAGGQPQLVAWSLVAINVLAIGLVAWAGALLAERAGRPAVAGLLLASVPGLLLALARDLSDAVALALLLLGVVALQRQRYQLATLAWLGAVLSREQTLAVVAAYGLWRLADLVRRRARPGWPDLVWTLPALGFAGWQAAVWARIGQLPLGAGESNVTTPFGALGPALGRWLRGDMPTWERITPVQLLLAVVLVVLALVRGWSQLRDDDRWLLLALASVVLVAVSLGEPVWEAPSDLRQIVDVLALAWVVLLLCPRRLPLTLVTSAGAVWLATAALKVIEI